MTDDEEEPWSSPPSPWVDRAKAAEAEARGMLEAAIGAEGGWSAKVARALDTYRSAIEVRERHEIASIKAMHPDFACWCGRPYTYHAERWGTGWMAASMHLEWHPYERVRRHAAASSTPMESKDA